MLSLTSFSTTPSLFHSLLHSILPDLVDANQNIRFAAIAQLAQWVGSNINEKELCCLAVDHTHFMGSHDRTEKNVAGDDNYVHDLDQPDDVDKLPLSQ